MTVAPHRFGGIEFRVGNREIGHLHGNYQADIPFSARLRKELVAAGKASLHHLYPNSGWSYYIHRTDDVPTLLELLRLNYTRLGKTRVATNEVLQGVGAVTLVPEREGRMFHFQSVYPSEQMANNSVAVKDKKEQKSGKKLTGLQKNWWLSAHVASSSIWLGTGLGMVIMAFSNRNTPNGDQLYAINSVVKLLDDFVVIPAAIASSCVTPGNSSERGSLEAEPPK